MKAPKALWAKTHCRRTFAWSTALLAITLVPAASAQFPPGPPPDAIDLGEIAIPADIQSPGITLQPGGIVWFKFRLLEAITRRGAWLNIDTAGPDVVSNNMIVLYNDRAIRISCDNDDGGGTGSNNNGRGWSGALTFGSGNGERVSGDDPDWGGGAISDGRDGWLLPGTYYLGVIGWISGFDHCGDWLSPNLTWGHNTSSSIAGLVRCHITTGSANPTIWNESRNESGDGGGAPLFASELLGNGPLSMIVGTLTAGERDFFKIRVCDPSSFRVTAFMQQTGSFEGISRRSRLFLFDEYGRGIVGISNNSGPRDTILSPPADIQPGNYYLAISTNCGGAYGYLSVPYDAMNQPLWVFNTNDVPIAPDGPGAANPIAYSGSQADCHSSNQFHFRMTFQGACNIPRESECIGDLDGNGDVTLQDLAIILARFGMSCR